MQRNRIMVRLGWIPTITECGRLLFNQVAESSGSPEYLSNYGGPSQFYQLHDHVNWLSEYLERWYKPEYFLTLWWFLGICSYFLKHTAFQFGFISLFLFLFQFFKWQSECDVWSTDIQYSFIVEKLHAPNCLQKIPIFFFRLALKSFHLNHGL